MPPKMKHFNPTIKSCTKIRTTALNKMREKKNTEKKLHVQSLLLVITFRGNLSTDYEQCILK